MLTWHTPLVWQVRYGELFKEDADFNQSGFVELCRALCLRAPREYVGTIEHALREADRAGKGGIGWADALAAVREVDPTIPDENATAMAAAGFGLDPNAASPPADAIVDIRLFCRRLLYSYPRRYGPPPPQPRAGAPSGTRAQQRRRSDSTPGTANTRRRRPPRSTSRTHTGHTCRRRGSNLPRIHRNPLR